VKHLDLFSGIGGFALGLQKVGFETVAFCEIDKYCQTLLNEKWKGVKIYNDVREITKEKLEADGIELPEIITGGFPCQPFSVAGKQKGTSDDRHLWPEMFRIIKELKPRWVIGENVKGLINLENGMVFETVCTNLEGEGYEVRAFNIPAAGVGAPHRRERIWIVAHRKESMVNADGVRLEQHNETKKETSWWRTSTTFKPTSNVVNTISNDKGREISRSDEEEGRIQEEHRQENSTSRVISGTSSVWQTDHGYEKNVANSNTGNVEAGRERQWGICQENTSEGQSNNVTSSSEVMANTEQGRSPSESIGNTESLEEESKRGKSKESIFNLHFDMQTDVANTESKQSDTKHNGKESREVSEQEQSESRGSRSIRCEKAPGWDI
jgi:DNA (cytosine-5)-methyltransferase 1